MTDRVRLIVDLAPDVAEALKKLARLQDISLTEAIARAISTEHTLVARRQCGARVFLEFGGMKSELLWRNQ